MKLSDVLVLAIVALILFFAPSAHNKITSLTLSSAPRPTMCKVSLDTMQRNKDPLYQSLKVRFEQHEYLELIVSPSCDGENQKPKWIADVYDSKIPGEYHHAMYSNPDLEVVLKKARRHLP